MEIVAAVALVVIAIQSLARFVVQAFQEPHPITVNLSDQDRSILTPRRRKTKKEAA